MKKKELVLKLIEKRKDDEILSISDIQEKEFQGEKLLKSEMEALHEFRRLRIQKLKNTADSESRFHKKFEYLRTLSNVLDYRDFMDNKLELL